MGIENHKHVTPKRKNKYLSEYRLCPNIWSLFEIWKASFNKKHVFSEHMQHNIQWQYYQFWDRAISGSSWPYPFLIFCRIKLKCFWLYKKRWHTSWKFQLEIRSYKNVIAKKPLTNLYEMNSSILPRSEGSLYRELSDTVLVLSNLKKINATAPKPQRTD